FGSYRLSTWLRSLDQHFESDGERVRRIDPAPDQTRLALLNKAYDQTQGPNGLAHLGQLGNTLRALDPDYKRHFGGKKLSAWLEEYPHTFKIHDDHYVSLA
ncbi:MAG: OST-HTH/LOTUS domain-containing protein, partial [Anaerolineae bacterium]|nr:OST-HTH/LOTUS domain-containing protein [Anaerolineae bacterium]